MAEEILPEYLTELVCTRISHDVIGKAGAVANAEELLEEGDLEFLDDIRSILKASSKTLMSRLKFFRLAFGLANANLKDMSIVQKITKDYLETIGNPEFPISLNFSVSKEETVRPALVVIMILADTLIKGGEIEAHEVGDQFVAIVHSKYPLANEKIKGIEAVLNGQKAENEAQYAPVVYLQNILNNKKKINIIQEQAFGFVIR